MTADETVAATQQGVFKHNTEHGLVTSKVSYQDVSSVQSNHDNHLQKRSTSGLFPFTNDTPWITETTTVYSTMCIAAALTAFFVVESMYFVFQWPHRMNYSC